MIRFPLKIWPERRCGWGAWVSRACACLVTSCTFAFASQGLAQTLNSTILTYQPSQLSGVVLPPRQQSAFHGNDSAALEAKIIQDAWRNEPVTVPWTRLLLGRYVKHKMMPTRGARGLALVHVAMHDAYQIALQQGLNANLAVSMAAAQVLGYLFVAEEGQFDRVVAALLEAQERTQDGPSREVLRQSVLLGFQVGKAVVVHAETDGAQKGWNGLRLQYYGEGRYFGPGSWVPTPPYFYYPPDEPFAPSWRPWILSPASEFRPTPPAYGSPKYIQDLNEVVTIAANLTDEQRRIARFWVDGHGSVTPPGHWNQIAITEVLAAKLDDKTTARLFAHMNIALADAFIAVWDAKYHYWTTRPITAAKNLGGGELNPSLLTPPFPSYVSGHAGFSGAAARVLGAYLPARSQALDLMAEEAAYSRLLGGIHFRHDNDDGIMLGRKVADKVLKTLYE